jgi:hypothetical protein
MSIYLENDIDYYKSELQSKDQQIKDLQFLLHTANNYIQDSIGAKRVPNGYLSEYEKQYIQYLKKYNKP